MTIDRLNQMREELSCEECGTRLLITSTEIYCPKCGLVALDSLPDDYPSQSKIIDPTAPQIGPALKLWDTPGSIF